ncbi:hypothetical protein ABIF63_000033 [Bradyrhizobium japonicum]|uniref:Transposase n=1 Tax=Bradyrhizobium japonicum TaxID=375 RepID=A0ABV2RHZ0_BRAJP
MAHDSEGVHRTARLNTSVRLRADPQAFLLYLLTHNVFHGKILFIALAAGDQYCSRRSKRFPAR